MLELYTLTSYSMQARHTLALSSPPAPDHREGGQVSVRTNPHVLYIRFEK